MTSSNGNIFPTIGPLSGNSPVTGEIPAQRPVTRSFDVFFNLRLNKCLSKQPRRRWFETPSCSLGRHCNDWNYALLPSKFQSNNHCNYLHMPNGSEIIKMITLMNLWITDIRNHKNVFKTKQIVINLGRCSCPHNLNRHVWKITLSDCLKYFE